MAFETPAEPVIRSERLPMVRRQLLVKDKYYLTPNMIRIILTGDELAGFRSPSPDDNIKVFTSDADGKQAMRSYTPRKYDPEQNQLVVDFAVHEAGPATKWALDVKVGEPAVIGGPRGSKVIEGDIQEWVLIGDETALPAMLRRVEEAKAGVPVTMIASVPQMADEQTVETQADFTAIWVHRNVRPPEDAAPVFEALETVSFGQDCFVWLAAEGRLTKDIRAYLSETRKVPVKRIKATGYWVKGQSDTTAKFD